MPMTREQLNQALAARGVNSSFLLPGQHMVDLQHDGIKGNAKAARMAGLPTSAIFANGAPVDPRYAAAMQQAPAGGGGFLGALAALGRRRAGLPPPAPAPMPAPPQAPIASPPMMPMPPRPTPQPFVSQFDWTKFLTTGEG